jgi:single-strand DNA-binding protein
MSTSRSLNKVMLIGNLTRNPAVHTVGGNGSLVCTFGVATNSTWKDAQSNLQERTEFHNIVAWNKLGEICAQILCTGMLVYIEGELRTRTWDDEKGNRHFKTEVKLNDMKLLDAKGKKGIGLDEAKKNALHSEEKDEFVPEETAAPTTPTQPVVEEAPAETTKNPDEGEDLF